jgi:fumarate hydratase, class II
MNGSPNRKHETAGADRWQNMCQSSNDVIPGAIHVSACIEANGNLIPALSHLHEVIDRKAAKLDHVVKTRSEPDYDHGSEPGHRL